MPLFLLIAQQRSACAYTTDTPHLKMLGELYDRCQETLDQFQAFIGSQLTAAELSGMLPSLLGPVARAAEDESGKVHPKVKELAAEALQLLQRRAEAPEFVAAYQAIKEEQRAAATKEAAEEAEPEEPRRETKSRAARGQIGGTWYK